MPVPVGIPNNLVTPEVERVFREHYRLVYRTAYGITGSAEDAEDILQTIFLRLLRRESLPDLAGNPRAYLYRAAVNLSLNTLRLRQRHVLTSDWDQFESAAPGAGPSDDGGLRERLRQAMATLDSKTAEIVVLRYVHDHSDAEIARLLGVSRGAIALRLFRARGRIRKLLAAAKGDKP